MKNPVQVAVNNLVDPSKLYQAFYDPSTEEKFSLLVHLLKLEKNGVVMVFCNTRRNVDRLTRGLRDQKIDAIPVHGGLSQNQRSSALQRFHERDALVLVCTDVAARGLDIKDVSHVYNFDIPSTPSEYIHRIGRTARAGKNGIAISFVCPGDRGEFKQIFRDNPNMERLNVPKLEFIASINFKSNDDRRMSRSQNGGRRGGSGRGRFSGGDRHGGRREGGHGGFGGRSRPQSRHSSHSRPEGRSEGRSESREGRPPSRRFLRGKSAGSRFGRR
jgi:ATP-dependent RNA helicase DeaD